MLEHFDVPTARPEAAPIGPGVALLGTVYTTYYMYFELPFHIGFQATQLLWNCRKNFYSNIRFAQF